jgi:hypothetical protein
MKRSTSSLGELRSCTRRNLITMYDTLQETEPSIWNISTSQHEQLCSALLKHLPTRPLEGGKSNDVSVIVMLFTHKNIEMLPIHRIVANREKWETLVPPNLRARITMPILTYKFADPIWVKLCNYAKLAQITEQEALSISEASCPCTFRRFRKFIDPDCGHIITTDTAIMGNEHLAEQMSKGTMYRMTAHAKGRDMGDDLLRNAIMDLNRAMKTWKAGTLSSPRYLDVPALQPWINYVLTEAGNLTNTHGQILHDGDTTHSYTEEDLKRLTYMHKHFVITTVDKAGNNFCIVCKKHYLNSCTKELLNGVAYSKATFNKEEIITNGTEFCNKTGIISLMKAARVPNFHIRVKLHKKPIGFRFVAGSSKAPLAPVSQWLTLVMKAILEDANNLWIKVAREIPGAPKVDTSWIIHDSQEVRTLIDRCNKSRPNRVSSIHLATYDFTSMYTMISLEDLKIRLSNLLERIFSERYNDSRRRYILLSKDGTFQWISTIREPSADEKTFSLELVKELLEHLVDHTYVCFAGIIWHQIVGVPMGTNAAGFIANLYCFTYELDFLERKVREKQYVIAKKSLDNSRYIDDLLTIDFPEFESLRYLPGGIYPKHILQLNVADSGDKVPYLDLFIHQNKRRGLVAGIYDKRLDDKFKNIDVIRYPAIDSYLSSKAKYGIVDSQMFRFSRRCSKRRDFVYNTSLVIYRLQLKDYCMHTVWTYVRKFMQNNVTMFDKAKVAVWIKRFQRRLEDLQFGYITPGPEGLIVAHQGHT